MDVVRTLLGRFLSALAGSPVPRDGLAPLLALFTPERGLGATARGAAAASRWTPASAQARWCRAWRRSRHRGRSVREDAGLGLLECAEFNVKNLNLERREILATPTC